MVKHIVKHWKISFSAKVHVSSVKDLEFQSIFFVKLIKIRQKRTHFKSISLEIQLIFREIGAKMASSCKNTKMASISRKSFNHQAPNESGLTYSDTANMTWKRALLLLGKISAEITQPWCPFKTEKDFRNFSQSKG